MTVKNAYGKPALLDEEICQKCVQIVAFRTVEDGDHHEIVHNGSVLFIGDAPLVSAMRFHAAAFATSLTYKGVGGNVL